MTGVLDETDEALELESSLIPVLSSYLGGGAASTVASTPHAIRTMIEPVLLPLLIGAMLRMRRAGALDPAAPSPSLTAAASDLVWSDKLFKRAQNAVIQASEDIARMMKMPEMKQDIYDTVAVDDRPEAKEARRIARTVSTSIVEEVRAEVADDAGMTHKIWSTRLDSRVRPDHVYLEGSIIPINNSFLTPGGIQLRYPGDRSAPPNLWIGCRCSLRYVRKVHTL